GRKLAMRQVAGKTRDELARHEAAAIDRVAHEVELGFASESTVEDIDPGPAMRFLDGRDEPGEVKQRADFRSVDKSHGVFDQDGPRIVARPNVVSSRAEASDLDPS